MTSVGLRAVPAPPPGMARRVRLVASLALAGGLVGWMAGQLAAETDAEAVFELLETEIHSVFQKFANGQLEAKEVDAS